MTGPAALARAADGVWEVCGHAEVTRAARDPQRFSSRVSAHLQLPNGLDGAEHREYRALVDRYLTADRVRALEPMLRTVARELVGELFSFSGAGAGEPVAIDAVVDLGAPFAVRAQTRWLGWPAGLEPRLLAWMADNYAATRSGDTTRRAEVAHRFDAIIRSVLAPRRAAGARAPDDVTTELIRDESIGRPLEDDELVSILRNWTGGDLGSIALCVGVILHFLAAHRELQDRTRAGVGRTELGAIVDEILRRDDPFVANRRITTCPVELGGVRLAAGERLRLNWTAANVDPRAFAEPAGFDPVGHAAANVVYGTGPHVCPGRELATTELCILLEELFAAAGRIELDPAAAPRRAEPPVGGYARVPLLLWA